MSAEAEKAFEEYVHPGIDPVASRWDVWLYACAWQRERDAQICDRRAAADAPHGQEAAELADEIREQDAK